LISTGFIIEQAQGSGRIAGDLNFDPLEFSKTKISNIRYANNEINHCRLAMIAFSGIVTQAALQSEIPSSYGFPYY
jgi:light-harvesting complex I chlorophyll a/b binding protein 1